MEIHRAEPFKQCTAALAEHDSGGKKHNFIY